MVVLDDDGGGWECGGGMFGISDVQAFISSKHLLSGFPFCGFVCPWHKNIVVGVVGQETVCVLARTLWCGRGKTAKTKDKEEEQNC